MSRSRTMRKHKEKTFHYTYSGSKRTINRMLTEPRKMRWTEPDGRIVKGVARLADKRYYRIYEHKGSGWTLYLGPDKRSHGGLRHKPSKKGRTATARMKREKAEVLTKRDEKRSFKNYDEITFGPHEGKYFDKRTGNILTRGQILELMKSKGIKR